MDLKDNQSFCILPFIHLATDAAGRIKVCCKSKAFSNLQKDDMETFWNSEKMKNTRLKMLKGESVSDCHRCYTEEKVGHKSKRKSENNRWLKKYGFDKIKNILSDMQPDGSVPFKIHYFDFAPGTKCNLKCLICDSESSNLWIKDHKAIYPKIQGSALKKYYTRFNTAKTHYDWYKRPIIQKQLYEQLKNIRHLYFLGGEPLIIDEHYKILDYCISNNYAKDMHLMYNSNGTTWKDNLFEKWKHFSSVEFDYSVDDIGERNSYIRYPSKWDRVEKSFHIFDEQTPSNVKMFISCTVQILNVYYLPDFIDWFLSKNFRKIKVLNFHLLHYPPQLNPKVLPLSFKKKLRKKYMNFLPNLNKTQHAYFIDRLQSILRFVEDEDLSHRLPDFREYVKLLDKQRNTFALKTFPDLEEIF